MEPRNLLLAVVISLAVFVAWDLLSVQMGWIQPREPVTRNASAPTAQTAAPAAPAAPQQRESGAFDAPPPAERPLFTPAAGRQITVETPLYRAVFHSNGGILQEFYLKHYTNGVRPESGLVNLISRAAAAQGPLGLLVGGLPSWLEPSWAYEGGDLRLNENGAGVLRFIGEIGGLRLTRELSFVGSEYLIRERLRVSSYDLRAANIIFTFSATSLASERMPGIWATMNYWFFGGPVPAPEESVYNTTRVAWLQDKAFREEGAIKKLTEGRNIKAPISWMAVMNNYFMGAISMNDPEIQGVGRMVGDRVFSARMGRSVTVSPGQDAVLETVYFLGPKDSRHLANAPNDLDRAINYGWWIFAIFAKPLVWVLQFFYSHVHNYGVAIVLLTIVIKILFWPLSHKSFKAMQQMKQLQPMMKKLQEKHAGDRETLNRELMQLYKTYKVNPASGCLPVLVQLPIFIAFYQALLNAIELRHATFITTLPFTDLPWLVDLSSRDPYFITPVLMGAIMFLQQKITPMPGDPLQVKIFMFLPVIMTVLFLTFPAGLVLYWLVNSVISVGQQWWQLRNTPVPTAAPN